MLLVRDAGAGGANGGVDEMMTELAEERERAMLFDMYLGQALSRGVSE